MAVVITGDLISSSQLALAQRQQNLNQLIGDLFSFLRSIWRRKEQLRTEAIQGDAFQVYLFEEKDAIRAALMIKCFCLAQNKVEGTYRFNCRLSIGLGKTSLLHPDLLAKSGGVVFEHSGRGLKEIKPTGPQLIFKAHEGIWARSINMGLSFADELLSRCTPAQSQAILLKLAYPQQPQEWLAERVHITRSAYSQRLAQTGWMSLDTLLSYYTETIKGDSYDTV